LAALINIPAQVIDAFGLFFLGELAALFDCICDARCDRKSSLLSSLRFPK
jgi:hypothetical protein